MVQIYEYIPPSEKDTTGVLGRMSENAGIPESPNPTNS
ncbi:hypothetical protein LEP1GSC195_1763 [Leptospira wolbachii serovar Codice str. CDC]|uniref:Uncharacterized protein n=1 Tax=Leptospira wolbachii serovar Codice str. CDC TaxID=1218599 RepID=R9A328_9LEPT|nr:hypothetical protein LEP1GSC195_1763 [Leptospira wolbachii serovar Codice str. CDC]